MLEQSTEPHGRPANRTPPSGLNMLVVLVASSTPDTQQRTLANMEQVDQTYANHRAHVDWAVVAYDDRSSMWNQTRLRAYALRTTRLLDVLDASTGRKEALSVEQRKARLEHQLTALRRILLPRPSSYTLVWMPDDDLSLARFDLGEYLRRWLCLFPGGPPVISQPPVVHARGVFRARRGDKWAALDKPFLNYYDSFRTCATGELTHGSHTPPANASSHSAMCAP